MRNLINSFIWWWLFVSIKSNLGLNYQNNVCRNLQAYQTILTNKNCYYNPDLGSSIESIVERYGYSIESYTFTSTDGYILTWHRLHDSKQNSNKIKKKTPVLLHHGISLSSIAWVMAGKQSVGFYLVDKGFDVWMANVRGNVYSSKHTSPKIDKSNYWNFGLEEMAIYDLTAGIDLIGRTTDQKGNIIFIGHSMGTTISFIYASTKGQHAETNIKKIIALAPVAYLKNLIGGFKLLASNADLIASIAEKYNVEALAESNSSFSNFIKQYCTKFPLIGPCAITLLSTSGTYLKQLRMDLFPIYFDNFPTALSGKLVKHFAQMINSNGRFPMYDYGIEKNIEIYNNSVPPDYDLSQISIPVHLLVGTKDFISSPIDAELLKQKLDSSEYITKPSTELITLPLSHFDFLFAKRPQMLYDVLLKTIQQN